MNMHNERMTMQDFLQFFYESQDKEWLVQEAVEDAQMQIAAFHQDEIDWTQTAREFNITIVKPIDKTT
tara:strand:+ start:537 stop:740 length:204 start_codon:yes stop_codon:yes gene_type:complete